MVRLMMAAALGIGLLATGTASAQRGPQRPSGGDDVKKLEDEANKLRAELKAIAEKLEKAKSAAKPDAKKPEEGRRGFGPPGMGPGGRFPFPGGFGRGPGGFGRGPGRPDMGRGPGGPGRPDMGRGPARPGDRPGADRTPPAPERGRPGADSGSAGRIDRIIRELEGLKRDLQPQQPSRRR